MHYEVQLHYRDGWIIYRFGGMTFPVILIYWKFPVYSTGIFQYIDIFDIPKSSIYQEKHSFETQILLCTGLDILCWKHGIKYQWQWIIINSSLYLATLYEMYIHQVCDWQSQKNLIWTTNKPAEMAVRETWMRVDFF